MTPKGFESIDAAQRDHSPERLNANVCKAALAYVHAFQKDNGTLCSLERMLTLGPVVTRPEYEVVCRALHTEPRSVPLAVSRWYGGAR